MEPGCSENPTFVIKALDIGHSADLARLDAEARTAPWSNEMFLRELSLETTGAIGAFEADKLIGFLLMQLVESDAQITNFAVDPIKRRTGIGTALLETAIDAMREQGGANISLEVRESARAARKLYGAAGFEEATRRPNYYRNPDEDGILLLLKL